MIFDLTKVDFTKEIASQLKIQYHELVEKIIEENTSESKNNKKVTLFHGTNVYYLNSILLNGIIPRKETKISNYKDELSSNKHLVYLTSKWHYWYAYNTFLKMKSEDNYKDLNIPCYIDCEVSSNNLIMDEDFFHSKYIFNRIKNCIRRNQPFLEITWEECLGQYGTVAHIGQISRSELINFTILAGTKTLYKNFIDEKSKYNRELIKWSQGHNKGRLTKNDLFELEDDNLNLFFQVKDIPDGHIITKFLENKDKGNYSLKFNQYISQ